jgi:membrane carboxypeptidase/penicillin-binding protein PbpC
MMRLGNFMTVHSRLLGKAGTSFRNRDAWAIGTNARYVVFG